MESAAWLLVGVFIGYLLRAGKVAPLIHIDSVIYKRAGNCITEAERAK